MRELIVCEKNNAAKRIAHILSAGKARMEKVYNLPVYVFGNGEGETRCLGLKGHILKVDFPIQYQDWEKVEPAKLIDAPIVKVPIHKSVVKVLQKLAEEADFIIIGTDFDREGELIGVDAINKIKEVNPGVRVRRARFSALTELEIKRAFSGLEDVYMDLAQAGEARQDIDLVWGATLTRFLSLASRRLWKQFLSVGRVQSPTLCLIAERERERQAFIPKPYWQIKALFECEGEKFSANHKTDKFWEKEKAEGVLSKLLDPAVGGAGGIGHISKVDRTLRRLAPPSPFNTTAFLSAAASLGISPSSAMRIAEGLYMEGLISYPRVDNTVYPPSLDIKGILRLLAPMDIGAGGIGELAGELLGLDKLVPTRGAKEATDHPPIHPTGLARKADLSPRNWKVYELICRRFLGTLAPQAVIENVRVDVNIGGEIFIARGTSVIEEGWFRFYPYGRRREEKIPHLQQGDEVKLVKSTLEEKETQPPLRYTQGRLILKMEELELGTKATRHEIIKNLYDRRYVHGDPIVPTEMGLSVAEALGRYAREISTPEMTASLEKDMNAIAEGRVSREAVVGRSRDMLVSVMLALEKNKKEVASEIREGIKGDRVVGKCPRCGQDLRIIRAKKTRKRFVGCTGYPACSTSYPLPQYGEVIALGETCEACGAPKVKVLSRPKGACGGKPWILCIDLSCPTKQKKE
ncbi:MAG: DNA topoisomerase I [Actinomycetota bacterium]|nr:DNA topoisomerase I [Actinomycetota bacterium]